MPRHRRPPRSRLLLRWLALVALVVIGAAYVQPVRAYLGARDDVERRRAEVDALAREGRALEARLAIARTDEFVEREARRLGLVRPGERLFVVSGVRD